MEEKEKEDLHLTQFFGPDYSGLPSYGSPCIIYNPTDVVIYFRFGRNFPRGGSYGGSKIALSPLFAQSLLQLLVLPYKL